MAVTITAVVSLIELLPKNKALLQTTVKNQDGVIVIDGQAKVLLPL